MLTLQISTLISSEVIRKSRRSRAALRYVGYNYILKIKEIGGKNGFLT